MALKSKTRMQEKDINYGKNDFLTYSFSFDRELEKLQVFDFALSFQHQLQNKQI